MSDPRCALCAAHKQGLRTFVFSPDVDIKVCQGHWSHILNCSQDGPYLNLPPGKVELLDPPAVSGE